MHKSNELLHTFNEFSAKRYQDVYKQFDQHIKMLVAMKADLDSIFRRIRYTDRHPFRWREEGC